MFCVSAPMCAAVCHSSPVPQNMALHLISLAAGSAFVPAQPKLVTSSGLGPTIGAVSGSVLAASAATLFSEPSTTTSNIIFSEPVGVMVFACAVSGVFLHFSSRTYEAAGIDEACVVQEEPTCGPMSFDSVCASRCPDALLLVPQPMPHLGAPAALCFLQTADMVCIEQRDEDGRLTWKCA